MANLCWSQRRFKLSNGLSLPCIGFGTFKIRRENDVQTSIQTAVGVSGYRLIDTAAVYRNEQFIAKSLKSIYSDKQLNIKVSIPIFSFTTFDIFYWKLFFNSFSKVNDKTILLK
jgi:diketogulonate reductase-like aldo/keto reductase